MKFLPVILVLFMLSGALSGCGDSGRTSMAVDPLDAEMKSESISNDVGRMTAWSIVESKKIQAVKAIETQSSKQKPEQEVKVVLDTEAKIQAWTNYKTTEALKEAVVEMAKSLRPRNKVLEPTPMPKGAFAEGVDSATGLVGTVVNSPFAVAGVVGYFVGSASKEAGTKVTATEGSEVNIDQSKSSNIDQTTVKGTEVSVDKSNNAITELPVEEAVTEIPVE